MSHQFAGLYCSSRNTVWSVYCTLCNTDNIILWQLHRCRYTIICCKMLYLKSGYTYREKNVVIPLEFQMPDFLLTYKTTNTIMVLWWYFVAVEDGRVFQYGSFNERSETTGFDSIFIIQHQFIQSFINYCCASIVVLIISTESKTYRVRLLASSSSSRPFPCATVTTLSLTAPW